MRDKSNPFGRIPPQPPRPPMIALDRFQKQIEAGHLIMFHVEEDLIFEVVSVGPVLNPSIPGGQGIQIVIQAKFPVMFQPAVPNRTMVICGETKARIEAAAGKNGTAAHEHYIASGEIPGVQESGDDAVAHSRIVLTDVVPGDDGGPGSEGAPRDLGDTGDE